MDDHIRKTICFQFFPDNRSFYPDSGENDVGKKRRVLSVFTTAAVVTKIQNENINLSQ